MTLLPPNPSRPAAGTAAFTLVEVLVAVSLSVVVLAGVLTANLQMIRSGVRITQYAEMESQVRRALDTLGRDVKGALGFKWNGESDITLVIPASNGATAEVTYAWTAASETFYRVAGADSTATNGRMELVRGIAPQAGGAAGLTFTRLGRDGVAVTTDAATRTLVVTLSVRRTAPTVAAASQDAVSAAFTFRNKISP